MSTISININIIHNLIRARNNNYYKITHNNVDLSTILNLIFKY